jgi:hypothetical protein
MRLENYIVGLVVPAVMLIGGVVVGWIWWKRSRRVFIAYCIAFGLGAVVAEGCGSFQAAIGRGSTGASQGFAQAMLVRLHIFAGWVFVLAGCFALAPLLRESKGEGDPRCVGCGYLLAGLTSQRCPECGRRF